MSLGNTVAVIPELGTVSRHFLRRTARARERRLERLYPDADFRVVSFVRGPFGFRVERTR
jgi:hypothetical protein